MGETYGGNEGRGGSGGTNALSHVCREATVIPVTLVANLKVHFKGPAQWHVTLILALGNQSQADLCDSKASVVLSTL